jgi:hypothetical protein
VGSGRSPPPTYPPPHSSWVIFSVYSYVGLRPRTTSSVWIGLVLAQIWGQAPDAFLDAFPFNGDHLSEKGFGPLGFAAAQVAFPTLCPHEFPRTGEPETLRRRLVRLQLVFALLLSFSGHGITPSTQPRGCNRVRGEGSDRLVVSARSWRYLLFAGARIISIVRPSIFGAISIVLTSESSSAICLRSSRAISG